MPLPARFQPFVEGAPATVMTRLALEWLIDDGAIRQLFGAVAVRQYEREFTLTQILTLLVDGASGVRPSPRAALAARRHEFTAALSAFYGQLQRREPALAEAVVRDTAQRARALLLEAHGQPADPIPGYPTYVVAGNVLAGTDQRLTVLRKTRAAALSGTALAVFEDATQGRTAVVLGEDAYPQERALLARLPRQAGQLWLA